MGFTAGFDISRGYRHYAVQDRKKKSTVGALCLPVPDVFNGTRGRLMLQGGKQSLRLEEMSGSDEGLCADANLQGIDGVYTTGIGGCQAIGIFTHAGGTWGRFFFQHSLAGYCRAARARKYLTNPGRCWAIVAQCETSGFDNLVGQIVALGVPKARIIVYIAGDEIFNFGVRLRGGTFVGHFGEIDL